MRNAELTDRISTLASRQDGVLTRRQLIAAGVDAHKVDSRVKNRVLRKLYAGVYAFGHDRLTPLARQRAAVMAGGPNAVLSHRAAASLLGLLPPNGKLEVIRSSSPDRHRPPPAHASRAIHPGLTIHRTRSLAATEVTSRHGIPVTSPVRTVINLAERESPKTLDLAIRRGVADKILEIGELARAVDRCRGRKGIAKLRKVLEKWNPGKLLTRSELESKMSDIFVDHGIPAPIINDRRAGYEIDFQWDGSNILVEGDGGMFHLSPADRNRDYRKMLDLAASGHTVVRITDNMVLNEPRKIGITVRKLLEEEGVVGLQPLSPQPVAVNDRAPP